jgi:hypothetical protein
MSKWQKPNRGDRLNIPAETFSLMIDAARAHSEGEGKNLGGGKTRPGSHLVSVENATGGSLDQFSVLEINGVSISPDDNLPEFTAGPILEGIAPTTTCPGKFAVIQQPLTEDEVGRAVVDGVTACKVYVTDNDHEWAEAESGETARLASGTSGSARILWHETIGAGPDTVWAVVALQAAASGGAAEHNLLSETHSDTTEASPPDSGDIIIGSSGKWTVLSYLEDGKILGAVDGLPAWVAASGATLSTEYPLAVGASAVTGDGEESLPWNHVHAGVTSIGLADADPADPKQGVITLSEGYDIEITESSNAFIFANISTLQTVCVRGATTETTITTSNTDGFIINGYHTHEAADAGHQYSFGYENDGGLTDLVLSITDNAGEPATTELRRYDQSAGKWVFAKPVDVDGNITALDGFAVRMQNDAETYSVGLKASNSLEDDLDFVMPTEDGDNGQAIVTDGNKNLSFASVKPTAGTNISVSGTQVSLDLTDVTGYEADVVQILGHDDSGVLRWYDVDECD